MSSTTWEEYYNKYGITISRYLVKLTGNPEVAEDLHSEVFLRAGKALNKGKEIPPQYERPWLLRIAHNLAIDYFRRAERSTFCSLEQLVDEQGDHFMETESNESPQFDWLLDLQINIHALNKKEQQLLCLLMADADPKTLAIILELKQTAIKTRINRLRDHLRSLQVNAGCEPVVA